MINWLHTLSGPGCCSGPGSSPWLMNLKAQYSRVNRTRSDDVNTIGPRLAPTGFAFSNVGGFPPVPGRFPVRPESGFAPHRALNLFQASADFAETWAGHQVQFGASYYCQDNRNIFSFQDGLFTLGGHADCAGQPGRRYGHLIFDGDQSHGRRS